MLGGVDVAGAEQHREGGHRQRDQEREVAEHGRRHRVGGQRAEDGGERTRHRLELQGDIGDGADDGDQRHRGGDALILAVAGGDEIGDRGDVLRLGEAHDAHQERRRQTDHQGRPDIDGEKVVAGAGGESDRAEERPRRAVDRQRQRVDQQPAALLAPEQAQAIAVARDDEQRADVTESSGDDDPALQHLASRLTRFDEPPGRLASSAVDHGSCPLRGGAGQIVAGKMVTLKGSNQPFIWVLPIGIAVMGIFTRNEDCATMAVS